MRLATVKVDDSEQAAVRTPAGYVPLKSINRKFATDWPDDMTTLIESGRLDELNRWLRQEKNQPAAADALDAAHLRFGPLYRRPPKIWGIGLNYVEHAADLDERAPRGIPGSFMKPATTVIGPGESICIPQRSQKTTAEGELGVIIGRRCKNVAGGNWLAAVAGFTTIIDMTAEDILRQNTRYLTVSKSFDTFFSFGPEFITPEEIADVAALRVATVINGRVHAENVVANMTFSPAFLVSFLSEVMTLMPGDIISTGTPGAAPIQDGDTVECRIEGFAPLVNPVRDLKKIVHRRGTEENKQM
jgi:2-keto-4-pentenoate hydratase/2-oxohepta-3-ene-1,7-dioic acid hydratase in catechol pathway